MQIKKNKALKKVEKIPGDKPLIIKYSGREIQVSLTERLENLKLAKELKKEGSLGELEVVRYKLEKEFPELAEGRVSWFFEEPQSEDDPFVVIPKVTAAKKG